MTHIDLKKRCPIRSFSGTGAGRYGQLGLSTDKFWSVDPWLKQIQKWLIIIQWTADGYILNFRHGPIWTVDQDFIVGGRDFCPDRPPHGRIQTTNGHIDQSHGRKWRPECVPTILEVLFFKILYHPHTCVGGPKILMCKGSFACSFVRTGQTWFFGNFVLIVSFISDAYHFHGISSKISMSTQNFRQNENSRFSSFKNLKYRFRVRWFRIWTSDSEVRFSKKILWVPKY